MGPALRFASAYAKDTLSVFFIAFCLPIKDMFLFLSMDGTKAGVKGSS